MTTEALVPYGYEFSQEEPVEGEFRELPEGPDESFDEDFRNNFGSSSSNYNGPSFEDSANEGKSGYQRAKDWWNRKKEERDEKSKQSEEAKYYGKKTEYEKARMEAELEAKKADIRAFKKRGRPSADQRFEQSRKWMTRVVTLGGPVKMAKEREYLYHPKMGSGAYIPTSMRSLTTPRTSKDMYGAGSMKSLTMPSSTGSMGGISKMRRLTAPPTSSSLGRAPATQRTYSDLKTMTDPGRVSSPIQEASRMISTKGLKEMAFVGQGASSATMSNMRALAIPNGLSPLQKLVFREVQDNTNVDTRANVVRELVKMGVSHTEAEQAVNDLLRRGIINFDSRYQGEPVLGVRR